jgi:ABC-2 type transport system ATP-binding protein
MIDDLLTLVDLNHKKEDFVDSLSRGMKQRLCLARTLAHDPQVLILDEPASGLDPRARIEMRELLRELGNMGKTIFFSSHILSEVSDVCTSVAILEAGNLIMYGNMAEMKKQLRPHRLVQVQTLADLAPLQEAVMLADKVIDVVASPEADLPPGTVRFTYAGDAQELSRLLRDLIQRGIPVVSFSEETGDLEDVFLQATQGIVN